MLQGDGRVLNYDLEGRQNKKQAQPCELRKLVSRPAVTDTEHILKPAFSAPNKNTQWRNKM